MPAVVIIGSGMAACAAAKELSQFPGYKITILESLDRTGGRINTVNIHGHPYDLGASWLHETLVNPLFDLAVENNIKMEYDDMCYKYYIKGKGELNLRDRAHKVERDILDAISLAYDDETKTPPPEISVKEFAAKFVASAPLLNSKQKRLGMRTMQKIEHYTAQSWEAVPVTEALTEGHGRNAFVLDGMRQVYDLVYNQIDHANVQVHLNQHVNSVSVSEDGCIVKTNTEVFPADYVICTVPLGQLKQKSIKFSPPLNSALQKSIDTTDMSSLGKVILEFPHCFWDTNVDEMHVMIDENASLDDVNPGNHPVSFVNIYQTTSPERGAVLIALTGRPLTQLIETSTSDKCFTILHPYLKAICRDGQEVPRPSWLHTTQWTTLPNFKGSYSARALNQTYPEMVQPFIDGMNRLRFAGEHTAYEGSGALHAAYRSGIREAQRVRAEVQSEAN